MSVNFDDDTVTLIGDNEDASFVETPKILVLMLSQSELVQKETTPTTINVHCSSFLKYINKLINEGRENECKTLKRRLEKYRGMLGEAIVIDVNRRPMMHTSDANIKTLRSDEILWRSKYYEVQEKV